MEKKKIKNYQIFSVIFTFILGTLLHFTYELSNENMIVATFSAINESVWEHLKLLFFPMLLTTIIGYFYIGRNESSFLCAKLFGIIGSLLFIIIFFYTYTGIIGRSILFVDIGSFFVAVMLGEYLAGKLINRGIMCNNLIVAVIITIILTCFITFTYLPPKIELFKDPVTKQYGI